MNQLLALSEELGHPGGQGLWLAAKRRGIDVQKKHVESWVANRREKQVLAPPQRAAGKTISEDDNRWMMDLVDVSNVPAGSFKFFLVCVNVFDRFMYARPLPSKEPREVAAKLEEILKSRAGEGRKKPNIVSSDNGAEFGGPVAALLLKYGIAQKFKDAGDLNALGLLDRQIGLLKRRLAEMAGRTKKSWAALLQQAVASLNATPKPGVLHGEAPADVRASPQVQFMLQQDQARAIQHNKKLDERRKAKLEESGGHFRPQLEISKFKRNYQAAYGDTQRAAGVEAGRVRTTSGASFPLKQIKIVPATLSGEASASSSSAAAPMAPATDRKRRLGTPILNALATILEGEERMSLTKASGLLKDELRGQGRDYAAIMADVKGKLIDLIRLAPGRFQLVEQPHGTKTWYYVALK